jgi:hypothetical protein
VSWSSSSLTTLSDVDIGWRGQANEIHSVVYVLHLSVVDSDALAVSQCGMASKWLLTCCFILGWQSTAFVAFGGSPSK